LPHAIHYASPIRLELGFHTYSYRTQTQSRLPS